MSFISKLEKFKIFVVEYKNVRRSDSSIYHNIVSHIKSLAYFCKQIEQDFFLEICLAISFKTMETKF